VSLVWGSFAKETYNWIDPTNRSHSTVSILFAMTTELTRYKFWKRFRATKCTMCNGYRADVWEFCLMRGGLLLRRRYFVAVWHDLVIWVTLLCCMTVILVWHDEVICVPWLMYLFDRALFCVQHLWPRRHFVAVWRVCAICVTLGFRV